MPTIASIRDTHLVRSSCCVDKYICGLYVSYAPFLLNIVSHMIARFLVEKTLLVRLYNDHVSHSIKKLEVTYTLFSHYIIQSQVNAHILKNIYNRVR